MSYNYCIDFCIDKSTLVATLGIDQWTKMTNCDPLLTLDYEDCTFCVGVYQCICEETLAKSDSVCYENLVMLVSACSSLCSVTPTYKEHFLPYGLNVVDSLTTMKVSFVR